MVINAIGFTLFLFAELVCFHGTILFPGLFGISQEFGIALLTVSFFSKAIGYFAASFISTLQRINHIFLGKVGVVFFIGGILLLPAIASSNGLANMEFASLVLMIMVGVSMGIGDALVNLLWGQQCASYRVRQTYLYVLGCQAGAALLYAITFFITARVQIMVVLLALVLVFIVLFRVKSPDAFQFDVSAFRFAAGELWRPVFGTSVFCFLTGLMPWISGQYEGSIEAMRSFTVIGTYIMLAVLSAPALLIKRSISLGNIYKFILPVMATGFLLLPIVWNGYGGVVNALAGAGTYGASIVLWCLSANSARQHQLNSSTVFGLSLGITTGANAFGRILGYFGGQSLTEGDVAITAISLVSLYLLSMIALVIFREKPIEHNPSDSSATKNIKVSDDEVTAEPTKQVSSSSLQTLSDTVSTCEHVAQQYQLSPREAEVLVHLSQGHSMVDIARELGVSENTARTHIKRIYRKLNVHSKQDIIDICRSKD